MSLFSKTATVSKVREYADVFRKGELPIGGTAGLAGRVIRGQQQSDFETFTDDAERKIVMFLGPDGLYKLAGKSGYECLVTIGYEPDYLRHKVAQGNQFKLVVVNEGTAVPATWDNVIDMVCQVYPESAAIFQRHRQALKTTPLNEIEAQAGFRFLDVEKAGKVDARFMTYERLKKSRGTLVDVRAFLYFSVHLRELFRGDGYTDDGGKRGPMEYIAPNMRIADCGEHEMIEIEVALPPEAPKVARGATLLQRLDKLGFRDPELRRVYYAPNLELAWREGRKLRGQVKSAAQRHKLHGGRLLAAIDLNWDFCDIGRLPVPGTFIDVDRIIERTLHGVEDVDYWSAFLFTHDYHPNIVVHGPDWWDDERGNPPDVTLPVMMRLVDPKAKYPFMCDYLTGEPSKPFRARIKPRYTTEEYAPHLIKTGQGPIWVFTPHCQIGSDGAQLIPCIVELIAYVSAALNVNPTHCFKGFISDTDWFGAFRPCMDRPGHAQGGLQTEYLDLIKANQVIEICGEAADPQFCVGQSMRQVMEYYGPGNQYNQDPAMLKRIRFLTNCTSPIIPDDPDAGKTPNADFRQSMQGLGVQMITHDSPMAI